MVGFLTIFWMGNVQAGEKKKVSYTKNATREISRNDIYPADHTKHKISQVIRIDTISYSDPDFGSSEDWAYFQGDSFAGSGSHRGYTVSHYMNGDKTYQKWEGTHKTTVKENAEWQVDYEGKYQFVGGTGKFKEIKGSGVYKGSHTAKGISEKGECKV